MFWTARGERAASILAAVAAELGDVGDHIVDLGLILQAGEGHGDAGRLVTRRLQIFGQRGLIPDDDGIFQRRRIFLAGHVSRLADDQAVQHGAVEIGRADADAVALLKLLEHLFARADDGNPPFAGANYAGAAAFAPLAR